MPLENLVLVQLLVGEVKVKARIIEQTIKDGNNMIVKYTIKGCRTQEVKTNSSGHYIFGDKSFSKGV